MIDPPAAAHVASSTSDGIACTVDWIHGCGGMPNQPSTVLNTPFGIGAVEELPQQHRDDRRDRRRAGRRAPSRGPCRACTSLISTAMNSGSGKPKSSASSAK